MNLQSIVMAAGALQAVILAFGMVTKPRRRTADTVLSVWLFMFAAELILFILGNEGGYERFPHLLNITMPFTFAYAVFFYIYARTFTGLRPWSRADLLHFIPFVLVYLSAVPFFVRNAEEKIRQYGAPADRGVSVLSAAFTLGRIAYGLAYVVWGYMCIRVFENRFRDRYSNLDRLKVTWLKVIAYFQAAIWCTALSAFLLRAAGSPAAGAVDSLTWPIAAVSVIAMGYIAIRRPVLGLEDDTEPARTQAAAETAESARTQGYTEPRSDAGSAESAEKYRKTPLDPAKRGEFRAALEVYMAEERPFLDPDLGIRGLADECGIPVHHLSQVINTEFGINFFRFINRYRIEEVKALLRDPANTKSILEIAFDSGFNSKSSFNTLFRRYVRMTPGEYRGRTTGEHRTHAAAE